MRLFDLEGRAERYRAGFGQPATFLQWVPAWMDARCTSVVTGFADGVVRILEQREQEAGPAGPPQRAARSRFSTSTRA